MPTALAFATLDVFTQTRFAGNPLAVVSVPHDQPLTQETKQTIAREFNLSETVILHLPDPKRNAADDDDDLPTWKLDIFLTDEEIPFAGHPVIGTAVHCLAPIAASSGQEVVRGRFECKAGPMDLSYDARSRTARARIAHSVHFHAREYDLVDLWSMQPKLKEYLEREGKKVVSYDVVSIVRGMTFLNVELPDLESLARVELHGGRSQFKMDEEWDSGPLMELYYVFTNDGKGESVKVRTRMIEGLFEDPATGSASAGLGAMLCLKGKENGKKIYEITQGVEMGRQSDIGLEVTMDVDGGIKTVELVGSAVTVMEGKITCD